MIYYKPKELYSPKNKCLLDKRFCNFQIKNFFFYLIVQKFRSNFRSFLLDWIQPSVIFVTFLVPLELSRRDKTKSVVLTCRLHTDQKL